MGISTEVQALRLRIPPPSGEQTYDVGDAVEVNTGSAWMPCRVLKVELGGTVLLNTKPIRRFGKSDLAKYVRPVAPKSYKTGDAIEYYSPTYRQWLACTVTAAHSDNSIEISIKPGFRLSREQQLEKVRVAGEAKTEAEQDTATFKVGQLIEYNSSSCGGWIPCHVTKVADDGIIQIDVKPAYDFTPDEQARKLRVPASVDIEPKRIAFTVGLEVEVLDETKDTEQWILTKVTEVKAN